MRAKQLRSGSLGQSARLYKLKTNTDTFPIPGAQGFGRHNPNIGSMLSLGITKQTRKAGVTNNELQQTIAQALQRTIDSQAQEIAQLKIEAAATAQTWATQLEEKNSRINELMDQLALQGR